VSPNNDKNAGGEASGGYDWSSNGASQLYDVLSLLMSFLSKIIKKDNKSLF
jgi:hypothetical protein